MKFCYASLTDFGFFFTLATALSVKTSCFVSRSGFCGFVVFWFFGFFGFFVCVRMG
jgi:hypothetical protein